MLSLIQIHIDKLKLEKHCNRKLLKYLDDNLNIEHIDVFPRHILMAKLWQKEKQNNYDAIKILVQSNIIKTYLQNKFKNIKKLSIVGILSGVQTFDSKINYYNAFIKSIKTYDLKQFRLILTQQNIDPTINDNEALCHAIIRKHFVINEKRDELPNDKTEEISNEMINMILNDPRTTSEQSIINYFTTFPYNKKFGRYILHSCYMHDICSKKILKHTKGDINNIINNIMDRFNNIVNGNEINSKIPDDYQNSLYVEKLLHVVCNNQTINLERFVDNFIKNKKQLNISSAIFHCIRHNDINLLDILLNKMQIKSIDEWCKLINHVFSYSYVHLITVFNKYQHFSLLETTFHLVKNYDEYQVKLWLKETPIDYINILQVNITIENLQIIELLLKYLIHDEMLDIGRIIIPMINKNSLNSIFTLGLICNHLKLTDYILNNTNIDPFLNELNVFKILNLKKREYIKLAEYFWIKIILMIDMFLIQDIRHIIFGFLKNLNHDIFSIM